MSSEGVRADSPKRLHSLQEPHVVCTDPKCPLREQLRIERLRCTKLAAANEVLRDAQQFLLSKCEASAEHANSLTLELEALRNERDALQTSIRAERLHLEEQRRDIARRWERVESLEAALRASKRETTGHLQENMLLREQVVSLQESVNKLSERLAAVMAANSQRERSRTPEKKSVEAPAATRRGVVSNRATASERPTATSSPQKKFGTLAITGRVADPPNFYDSPRRPWEAPVAPQTADERGNSPQHHDESEPRPLSNGPADDDSPPPPPPPLESYLVRSTPERGAALLTAQLGPVSPPPLPSEDYSQSMREALALMQSATQGLPPSLPRLTSTQDTHAAPTARSAGTGSAATSRFVRELNEFFRSRGEESLMIDGPTPANDRGEFLRPQSSYLDGGRPRSTSPTLPTASQSSSLSTQAGPMPRRYDLDFGVTASSAMQRFRRPGSGREVSESPPPPPPPPEDRSPA